LLVLHDEKHLLYREAGHIKQLKEFIGIDIWKEILGIRQVNFRQMIIL
jgi:hypothetical protein